VVTAAVVVAAPAATSSLHPAHLLSLLLLKRQLRRLHVCELP
jgi:hypothetical protein